MDALSFKVKQNFELEIYPKMVVVYLSKKCLPLADPIITSYPTTTGVLSILSTDSGSNEWIHNNFIQLYSRGKDFIRTGLEFYNDFIYKFCPIIRREYLTRESLQLFDKSIVDLLVKFIESEKYILIYLNQFYIPAYTRAYRKYHDYHAALIYGYDINNNQFQIADFFNDKYEYKTATFNEIQDAYDSMSIFTLKTEINGINLFSLNTSPYNFYENDKCTFDVELVSKLIHDYLNAIDSYAVLGLPSANLICGIKVFDALIENLNELLAGERPLTDFHIKPFHINMNHKMVMLNRFNFMVEKECLMNGEKIISHYNEVANLAKVIRNLALKSLISQDASIMAHVVENLKVMVHKETEVLQKLDWKN